jgi:chemotaxis protein CheZ
MLDPHPQPGSPPSGHPLSTLAARVPLQQLTERMRLLPERREVPEPVIVADVVTAVLDTMDGRLSPMEAMLLKEVAGLGRIIEQAKSGIAEMSVDAIMGSHIPSATDELGAIVEHTAIATDSILESCEVLDRLANTVEPAQAEILQAATTRIYEACSFQDITGQRITKVVKALQAIEARVLALSQAYGQRATPKNFTAPEDVRTGDKALLNGPGMAHEAMGQDDIDKLLADFG